MADASTGGGGLIGGAADPNQPKCFGCCCFMRCGVVVGEILCIVWFTLNLLLGIFGILGAIAPNDVARDAGLFCTLPDPVRAVYTDATCFGYDMCDCGGSICTEELFAGQMAPGRGIFPIISWVATLVWIVNAIVGLIAVCKHRYPLLRIVGFWKIAMIVIYLLIFVGNAATNGGGRQANHAADSYWRVAGAQQCAEWGSGLIPLENDLSDWGGQFDWDTAPTVAAQTCGGGGFGRRLQTDTGNWEPTARPTYNFLQSSRRGAGRGAPRRRLQRGGGGRGGTQLTEDNACQLRGGPRIDECGTKEVQCEDPRAGTGILIFTIIGFVIFFLIPASFVSYLIYCEIRLYREFAKSLPKGEDDSGYAMGAVGAMGAVKHVATATAVAKPVMATAVAKPVVTATAVAAA